MDARQCRCVCLKVDKTWSLFRWTEGRPKTLSYASTSRLPNFDISHSAGSGLSVPPRRHPHHRFVPPPSNYCLVATNAPTGHFSSPCSGLTREEGPIIAGRGGCLRLAKPGALAGVASAVPRPAHGKHKQWSNGSIVIPVS